MLQLINQYSTAEKVQVIAVTLHLHICFAASVNKKSYTFCIIFIYNIIINFIIYTAILNRVESLMVRNELQQLMNKNKFTNVIIIIIVSK